MGLFDEVVFLCPKCNNYIYKQTKLGECCMMTIHCDEVPNEIANDILGGYVQCEHCTEGFYIVEKEEPINTKSLRLE